MKRQPFAVSLATSADRDFLDIMDWSADKFGAAAADRYETLIGQALTDLGDDPFRAGAPERPDLLKGVYASHLASSRDRAAGERVKSPRHIVLYRIHPLHVEVLRILHDSRDLAQHLPPA